jgi:hypothetical protein
VTCDRPVVLSASPASSTNKTDHNDIAEILLKMALNTIKPIQTILLVPHKFVGIILIKTM